MRRPLLPAQRLGAQFFILAIVAICALFLGLSTGILHRIDEESRLSRQFLVEWLACKSDALAYLALPSLRPKSELIEELAACDRLSARLSDGPLIRAMRMLEGSKHPGTGLESSWSALRTDVAKLADAAAAKGSAVGELVPVLARASFLEAAVRERIGLIERFDQDQRRAVAILQQSLIAAAIVLVGLGIWSSAGSAPGKPPA
jgi:hypothetical protein